MKTQLEHKTMYKCSGAQEEVACLFQIKPPHKV